MLLGRRGELNGNHPMSDKLGGTFRKIDDEVSAPIRTTCELGTGDGGHLRGVPGGQAVLSPREARDGEREAIARG